MKSEGRSQKSEVGNGARCLALSSGLRRPLTAGFTIIEILVVIGVIVLLVGVLIPVVMRSYRAADRARISADMQSIGSALDAYHQDFGDYPRVDYANNPAGGTGFAVLCKALVAPGPTVWTTAITPTSPYAAGAVSAASAAQQLVALKNTTVTPAVGSDWAALAYVDGADGEGFRVRWDATTNTGSAIKPAYLQSGKFKVRGLAILDIHDNPIMYFGQSPMKINLNLPTGAYVAQQTQLAPPARTMYNFDDNAQLAASLTSNMETGPTYPTALWRMRMLMGDLDNDGRVDNGTPITTAPYILWSAGPDGQFGPLQDPTTIPAGDRQNAVNKCDDVTNFR